MSAGTTAAFGLGLLPPHHRGITLPADMPRLPALAGGTPTTPCLHDLRDRSVPSFLGALSSAAGSYLPQRADQPRLRTSGQPSANLQNSLSRQLRLPRSALRLRQPRPLGSRTLSPQFRDGRALSGSHSLYRGWGPSPAASWESRRARVTMAVAPPGVPSYAAVQPKSENHHFMDSVRNFSCLR